MKVRVTTNFLFPNLEEELTKVRHEELLQPLQNDLQTFLEHATEHYLTDNKQELLGVLNEFLENHQITTDSQDTFRKLPLNAIDFYCFADEELVDNFEKKYHQHYDQHPQLTKPIYRDAAALVCEIREQTNMKDTSTIIFLDFDGVLNTDDYYCELKTKGEPTQDQYGTLFSPASVSNLQKIIETTGAVIVATSAWRYQGLEQLQKMWVVRALPGHLVDITPLHTSDEALLHADLSKMDSFNPAAFWGKGAEIDAYLKENMQKLPLSYVILDDIKDVLPSQESHFIRINPKVGITEDDARKAISILKLNDMKQLPLPSDLHFEENKSLGKDYRRQDRRNDRSGLLGKARIHQAVFRVKELGIQECDVYGNYLTEADARKGLNFYNGLGIFEAVQTDPKQHIYNTNVYANMLRSEHIPFNIFIPLANNLDYCTQVMRKYMPWIESVEKVVIEYAPKPATDYLADRTSFDVYMEYCYSENGTIKHGIIGVEVKYTEREYHVTKDSKEYQETTEQYTGSAYQRVMEKAKAFDNECLEELQSDNYRQYWRNYLLGEAILQKDGDKFSRFTSILLYPHDNQHFASTSEGFKKMLNDKSTFIGITYEDFFSKLAISQPSDEYTPWIDYFNLRYIVTDWEMNE